MNKIFVFFILLANSSVSLANWQYTEWGMTAPEVVHASEGAVSLIRDPVADAGMFVEAEGTYNLNGSKLPVRFFFEEGKLQRVTLRPSGDPLCWAINQLLLGEYGKPFSDVPSPVVSRTKWRDIGKGNVVEFLGMGDVCFLNYTPINRPSGSGL